MVAVDKDTEAMTRRRKQNEKKRKGTQDKIEVTCVRVSALPPRRNLWSERTKGNGENKRASYKCERSTILFTSKLEGIGEWENV